MRKYYISKSDGISASGWMRSHSCESTDCRIDQEGSASSLGSGTTERRTEHTPVVSEGAFRIIKRRERNRARKIRADVFARVGSGDGEGGGEGMHLLSNANLVIGVSGMFDAEMGADRRTSTEICS